MFAMKKLIVAFACAVFSLGASAQFIGQGTLINVDEYEDVKIPVREGWQASAGASLGLIGHYEAYFNFGLSGGLGYNFTPQFYLGGGADLNLTTGTHFSLYANPRYYFSQRLTSWYIEGSLGFVLFGSKYEDEYNSDHFYKPSGLVLGGAVGYAVNKDFSVQFGLNVIGMKWMPDYMDSWESDGFGGQYALKAIYTFDLGKTFGRDVINKISKK